ncbi:MAG: ABC transporter ATP-binding protein [Syntrophales bacterium]|nr:ABC transporter ATP-binding protein [Syntrophales bacterium]
MLEVKNLSKHFGGLRAVDELSFKVEKGDILSIIGPNGSGKSTVFNLITGFHEPTEGRVLYLGEDITGLKPHVIARKGIARTFQHTTIYLQNTVQGNLIIAHRLRTNTGILGAIFRTSRHRQDEKQCLEKAEATADFIGLYSKRLLPASLLSQEEQKRLAIGIAIATEPQLLLLDEPMGGVTDKEMGPLMALIKKINEQGVTICLIEHKMGVVMSISNRVIVLNYGRKIAEGLPENVAKSKDVIEAYLGEDYHA